MDAQAAALAAAESAPPGFLDPAGSSDRAPLDGFIDEAVLQFAVGFGVYEMIVIEVFKLALERVGFDENHGRCAL